MATAVAPTVVVVHAQATPLVARRQTVAVNPLALPLGAISAEYERAIGRNGFAVGVGGSASFANQFDLSQANAEFASVQGKLKYYPSENGLRGFSVGITAGLVHGRSDETVVDGSADCPINAQCVIPTITTKHRATAPTLGAVVDYNWFIGRRRRFLVGLGAGARRVFGSSATRQVFGDVLPDGRLVVGYGF